MSVPAPRAALDLTHVYYDDSSHLSLALALVTLSPILLMASYAALAVQTRELTIILMWAGQFLCEAFNYVLKHAVKQERPIAELGDGYGFPSSHSQYMGYFASFLICHLTFRHRFPPTGIWGLDPAFRSLVYIALISWAGTVAYSRFHLGYHTPNQILWGLSLGVIFGTAYWALTERALRPLRAWALDHPLAQWLRLRDGWAVWADGGNEAEWARWRAEWDAQRQKRTE